MQDTDQEKLQTALDFCEKIEAIEECDLHSGVYIDTCMYSDYKELTATIIHKYPDSLVNFTDRNEMIDFITNAMNSSVLECQICKEIEYS